MYIVLADSYKDFESWAFREFGYDKKFAIKKADHIVYTDKDVYLCMTPGDYDRVKGYMINGVIILSPQFLSEEYRKHLAPLMANMSR